MKYMGSKNRIAKHILPIMLAERKPNQYWVEPFVGGANMIDKVDGNRIGIDYNSHTIDALIAIRDLADKLPNEVTEDYYKSIRGEDPEPIKSWIRFVCSYSGKFDNGFARQGNPVKYRSKPIEEGLRNAQKQSPKLQGLQLIRGSYDSFEYNDCLIYCDPPYEGTTSYKTGCFDHEKFWDWCREVSKTNKIFVSEYKAPSDFRCVWEGEVKTNFASQRSGATHNAVEKLFTL